MKWRLNNFFNPDCAVGNVARVKTQAKREFGAILNRRHILINMLRIKITKRALQQGFSGRSSWLLHNLG